jgi:Ca2+-binding RTX toxin-like protein
VLHVTLGFVQRLASPPRSGSTTVGPLYAADPLRSSDHDPLLVGLGLDSIPDNPTCNGLAATIIRTPGDDVIVGTNKSDVIVSFGGDDTISGGNGEDVICAGYGDDTVDGGAGKDLVFGEQGDDTIAGANGKDSLDGGVGKDEADGGNGKDVCAGLEAVLNCELLTAVVVSNDDPRTSIGHRRILTAQLKGPCVLGDRVRHRMVQRYLGIRATPASRFCHQCGPRPPGPAGGSGQVSWEVSPGPPKGSSLVRGCRAGVIRRRITSSTRLRARTTSNP